MTVKITTGGEIDSYCTKCKLILDHVILAMVAGTIVKVKCKTCGSTHRFKGVPIEKPKAVKKEGAIARALITTQALWENRVEATSGPELPYEMTTAYRAGDLIMHSVFGKGVVQKTLFKKCSVLFRDKERVLVSANT